MGLTLFVDHSCNLRCSYCYTGEKRPAPMPWSVAQRAIDFGLQRGDGKFELGFFGGEPLLQFGLVKQCVEYCQGRIRELGAQGPALGVTLNTNGLLLTDEVLDWLASVPSSGVALSLDGTAASHDLHRKDLRGQGSHRAVRAAAQKLVDRRIPVAIVCVVRPDTAALLGPSLAELLELGAESVTLAPDLSAAWDAEGYAALRQGLGEAAQVWIEALRGGKQSVVEPFVNKILTHVHGGIPCPERCQLGGRELVVAPSGRIYPCAQMVREDRDLSFVIGHIDTGIDLEKVSVLQGQKDAVEKTCEECALRDRCQSHCGCSHVALTGQLGVITDTLCETETLAIEAADQVAELLWAEQCSTFVDLIYRRPWKPAEGSKLTPLRTSRDGQAAVLAR